MNPIGGYFELELNDFGSIFHDSAIALNCGRTAFEYILKANNKIDKVYIPYYTCDVTLQPIERLSLDYEFYYLDNKFHPKIKDLNSNEVLLYVNYFGLMNKALEKVLNKFQNVIVDNSQAFYEKQINNTPTFYSPRKFFGVPDGGFAYTNDTISNSLKQEESLSRISHLIKRLEYGAEAGYRSFIEENEQLNNIPIRKMSFLTQSLLRNINYNRIREIRNKNFLKMHKKLRTINELTPILDNETINGPMAYPFLKKGNKDLKKHLIKNKVFVATYWPNVSDWLQNQQVFEIHLQENLIPIPIDQRYNDEQSEYILNLMKL